MPVFLPTLKLSVINNTLRGIPAPSAAFEDCSPEKDPPGRGPMERLE